MHYIIAAHVLYNDKGQDTFGPAHSIFEFLIKKKKTVSFLKHSLESSYSKIVINGKEEQELCKNKPQNVVIRSWNHSKLNFKYTKKIHDKKIYIGVDPVNSISGVLLKSFGLISKNIYFTADYTEDRFNNPLLNSIYHFVDKICLKMADEAWCVSSRIVSKRLSQGVDKKKVVFMPNSPDLRTIKPKKYDGNKNLIIVSNLTKSLNLKPILEVVKKVLLIDKKITLTIVGSGTEEKAFKKMVKKEGLEKQVVFTGQKNHDEVLDLLANSFLGFALYTRENNWNNYGDSMKAREYVALGLPVIINDIPATADDIKKYDCGLVIKEINIKEISNFIRKTIEDKSYYLKLRNNAMKLGQDFDKEKLLNNHLIGNKS